mgnify:CR=1 FL=1|tara:strand:- start:44 stop:598 length:555 start_codon:yes stop_codon:yes gene_type:complete
MAKTKRIKEGHADYPANAPEELKNLESFRYSSKSTQRKMIRDYSKREKTEAKDRAYLETVPEELRGSESFRASSRKEQRKRVKAYEKRLQDTRESQRMGDQPKPKRHFVKGAVGTGSYDPDWKLGIGKKSKAALAKGKRAKAKTVRKGKQAKRKASRSPGGFAGGGAIESYSAQVQRKYGGGKV